ncbi:MAG: hypothetical protein V3V61_00260 [Gammaproteobacteria bacterium]
MNKELKEAWEEHKDPVYDGPWGPGEDFKGGFEAGKDANKNIFNLVSKDDHSDIFIYAFRYTLGRMTCATNTLQDAIRAAWPELSKHDKKLIKEEIKEHKERAGKIGMDCDERGWMALLELED